MSESTTLTLRVDSKLKEDAQKLFRSCGLTVNQAFNIFLTQSLRYGGIPFKIKALPEPNAETLEAMKETEEILAGKKQTVRYATAEEMMQDVLKVAEDDVKCLKSR